MYIHPNLTSIKTTVVQGSKDGSTKKKGREDSSTKVVPTFSPKIKKK